MELYIGLRRLGRKRLRVQERIMSDGVAIVGERSDTLAARRGRRNQRGRGTVCGAGVGLLRGRSGRVELRVGSRRIVAARFDEKVIVQKLNTVARQFFILVVVMVMMVVSARFMIRLFSQRALINRLRMATFHVPTAFFNTSLAQLHDIETERVLGHDQFDDLMVSAAADDLVIDMSYHVIDSQPSRVRRAVLVGLDDEMLNRVDLRVVEEDFYSADGKAEPARALANHHFGPAQSLVHYFHEFFGLVSLGVGIRLGYGWWRDSRAG